jgi:pimeloyl-ACP methyl ester carboxylesterase
MPWSTNTSTKRKRQGYVWSGTKHENFSTFFMSAKQVVAGLLYPDAAVREVCLGIGLCDPNFGEVVIVGHSAGGSAIRMAARTQGLNSARPTKIIFSDAGYGTWTDQAWHHYVSKNSDCRLILLVRKWDKPYQNTMRFLKRFRQRIPKNIELYVFDRRKYYHSDIGDQSLKWVFTLQNQSL